MPVGTVESVYFFALGKGQGYINRQSEFLVQSIGDRLERLFFFEFYLNRCVVLVSDRSVDGLELSFALSLARRRFAGALIQPCCAKTARGQDSARHHKRECYRNPF